MKIAVLADIHGNYEALKAVFADMEHFELAQVISLGDNVGYGPEPDDVVSLLRQRGIESVLGNHEFALCDRRARRWLNFQAAENSKMTRSLLSEENLTYSCNLPLYLKREGGYFVHGFPKESVFLYLEKQSDNRVLKLFKDYDSSLFFLGHTHNLQLVFEQDGAVVREGLEEGVCSLVSDKQYIVNCGSVGQPRDGDESAKYIIWDTGANTIEVRFVPYDREKTKEGIAKRGFPKAYSLRL